MPIIAILLAASLPQQITCHLMFRGAPSPDETVYRLDGDTLYAVSAVGRTAISRAGTPLELGRSTDSGAVTRTWADHSVAGTILTRRVYWKPGTKPRYLRFIERYDFARQTVTTRADGDTCHHDGG